MKQTITACFVATVLLAGASYGADGRGSRTIAIKTTPQSPIEPTAAVPVFKMRQGEQFKIFDGIGGGLRWAPGGSGTPFHVAALAMLSSNTIQDSNDANKKSQVNIMSLGLVLGWDWFQIGFGRDVLTSESKEIFDTRSKNFLMLNLNGRITFE